MRGLFAILLVGMLMLPASASEGGVNEASSLDGTGIKSLDYEDILRASSGGNFEISLEIEDDTNISEVSWVTQVCVNTGVCYPPEERGGCVSNTGSPTSEIVCHKRLCTLK